MRRWHPCVLILVLPLLVGFAWPWTVNKLGEEGAQRYRQGDYAGAAEQYRAALEAGGESPEATFNLGTSLLAQRDYARAAEVLGRVRSRDPVLNGQAAYNRGNCYYRLGQYQAAAEAYGQALAANPADADAKYNLDLCQERLKKEPDPQCKNPEPKPDEKANGAPKPGAGKSGATGSGLGSTTPPPGGPRTKAEADAILERMQRSEQQLRSSFLLNNGQGRREPDGNKLGVPNSFWTRESDEKDW